MWRPGSTGDAVDDAVEAAGKTARRKAGKLPPQVIVYFVMALALFAGGRSPASSTVAN